MVCDYVTRWYDVLTTILVHHSNACTVTWKTILKQQWVHIFIHTLHMIPRNSYTLLKLRRRNIEWDELSSSFGQTFSYVDEIALINVSLQVIKAKFFEEIYVLVSSLL